jgi:hypothetical protein
VNPGRHGVFDFIRARRTAMACAHALATTARAAVAILNARRALIMNVPTTYPPEALDGVLVSGLGTPDFKEFTYPAALGPELERRAYKADLYLPFKPGENEDEYLRAQHEHTEQQVAAVKWLLREQAWDVALYVVRGTDEVAHHFWKHMDPAHPAHDAARDGRWSDALLDYYRLCDRLLGELIETVGPECTVLVVSDTARGRIATCISTRLRQAATWRPGSRRPGASWRGRPDAGASRARCGRWASGGRRGRSERLGERVAYCRATGRRARGGGRLGPQPGHSFGYHGQIYLNVRGREPEGAAVPGARSGPAGRDHGGAGAAGRSGGRQAGRQRPVHPRGALHWPLC